jgi:tetratricopeptide (TPR) repeat protein
LHSQALARTGKLDEARAEIEEARRVAPDNADFLLADARILQQSGQYAASITLLEQARKTHPRLAAIPYRIAIADFLLRRYEPARQQCAAALAIAPDDAAAWFLQGIVHLDAHEFPEARSSLERAVQLDQRSALYRTELGIALLKTGGAEPANEQLNQALRLAPKNPSAYYWRAMTLEQMQRPRPAIADLETAVALEPDYADAFYELARLYHAAGQPQKAAAALARNQALKAQRLHRDRQRLLQQIAPE